jgi:hypothetical protein
MFRRIGLGSRTIDHPTELRSEKQTATLQILSGWPRSMIPLVGMTNVRVIVLLGFRLDRCL